MKNQTGFSKALRQMPAVALVLAMAGLCGQSTMQAQVVPAPGTAPMTGAPGTKAATGNAAVALEADSITKYDNRWEIFGGLAYANGQAGQNLAKHYNMGGGEVMGTYWLGSHFGVPSNHLGIVGDYRIGAGTSPVLPQAAVFGLNRILIYQNIVSGGLQYRWLKNRYVALDIHGLAGGSHGTFDSAITGYPSTGGGVSGGPPVTQKPTTAFVGVYNDSTTPWGAAGGSIDFNASPRVAVRLQPDITFEHFGTETREFFSISAGAVWRFGKLQ